MFDSFTSSSFSFLQKTMKNMKRQRTRTTKPRRMAVTNPRTTSPCSERLAEPGEEFEEARASLQLQPGEVQH